MDVEQELYKQITEKIDWGVIDPETQKQVEVMIEVCADLWLGRSEQARNLEKAIVALWGTIAE